MSNTNETNVLNENTLSVTDESLEKTKLGKVFNIIKYGAIAYKDGIDINASKQKNAEVFEEVINYAIEAKGTIKIPNGFYYLDQSIVIKNAGFIKIVNEGVLVVDPLKLGADSTPSHKPVFQFQNCKNVYFEGGEIESEHGNGEITYSPEGHTRANQITTMLSGISIMGCENVVIENVFTYGLEYAVILEAYQNKYNEKVTIRGITTEETSQPILALNTRNLIIEDVNMTSRPEMSGGEHFIYCSRCVDTVHIGGNNKFVYSDCNYGCAINLRNGFENTDSVKYCRIDNVEVVDLYRQFVSAKADTKVICNNCKITTMEDVDTPNTPYIFFVDEMSIIDIVNCIVEDKTNEYVLVSLYDDVQVNISGGKFMGLSIIGMLTPSSGNETNSINLNVSFAEIETKGSLLFAGANTRASFSARFDYCNLSTSKFYFFRSQSENCKIDCYYCYFKYTGNLLPKNVFVAYCAEKIDENEVSIPLLNNIKIIHCTGDNIADVCGEGKCGEAIICGNIFVYKEDGITTINS